MKKTILIAFLAIWGCFTAMAQTEKSLKLEKNRVIYLTTDTVFIDPEYPDDPYYWNINSLHNPFNFAGMALNGADATDWNYRVAFRQDYTDPETGFSLKKGYYRGVTLMETTIGLHGTFTRLDGTEVDQSAGIKNLKKVIYYFVPLPSAKCTTFGYNFNHDRLPSNGGRVEAQYMNEDGTALSNNAYRDPTIGVTLVSGGTPDASASDGWSWDEYYYDLSNCPLNYTALADPAFVTGYNAALVTIDRPFKLSVDVTNPLEGKDFEDQYESETKKTELAKVPIDGLTDLELTYYFADAKDTNPFDRELNEDEIGKYTSASGWNNMTGKWGKKVAWTPDTPIKIGIKRRLYLVGIGLICGTDGAGTEYLNTGDYNVLRPEFSDTPASAFGNVVEGEMPENPWADYLMKGGGEQNPPVVDGIATIQSAVTDAPTYNLQGQRVKDGQKGIVVKGGKKTANQ